MWYLSHKAFSVVNGDLVVPSFGSPEMPSLHNSRSAWHESTIEPQQAFLTRMGPACCNRMSHCMVHGLRSVLKASEYQSPFPPNTIEPAGLFRKIAIGRMEHSIQCTDFPACFTIILKARAKMAEATRCTHMRTYYKRATFC